MFFAPPRVKSLSRYAEYGAYLNNGHFLIMLAVAITMHVTVIAIYSMMPSVEVVRIPVRVLNIKLSGGSFANGIHMPSAAPPTVPTPAAKAPAADLPKDEDLEPLHEITPEPVPDKEAPKKHAKSSTPHAPALPREGKSVRANSHRGSHVPPAELTLLTPKQYVRAGEEASASQKTDKQGNGGAVAGDAGGKEQIERYTQTISQWIKNHQIYARAVCGEMQAVGGQCEAKGQVVVRLRIDRDGHIVYNSVDKTSGKELVDQAAIAMVRASDPVPSVPSNYPSDTQLEFLIAVQVDLSK